MWVCCGAHQGVVGAVNLLWRLLLPLLLLVVLLAAWRVCKQVEACRVQWQIWWRHGWLVCCGNSSCSRSSRPIRCCSPSSNSHCRNS